MSPSSPLGSWHLLPSLQTLGLSLPSAPVLREALATSPEVPLQSLSAVLQPFWGCDFLLPFNPPQSRLSQGMHCPHRLLTGFPAFGTSSACIQMSFLKGKWDPFTHFCLHSFSARSCAYEKGDQRHPFFKGGSLGVLMTPP